MFRSLPRRNCWHFCENCPSWPWRGYEEANEPPRERWRRTCVRVYVAGTGEFEELAFVLGEPTSVFNALSDAFSADRLDASSRKAHQPPERDEIRTHRDRRFLSAGRAC